MSAHARDFAFELDAEGRILEVTEAAVRILGLPREGILGRSLFAFVDDEDALHFAQAFRAACEASETVRGYEICVSCHGDQRRWLRLDASPVAEPGGEDVAEHRYRGIARDVTSEKLARADAEALRERLECTLRAARDTLLEWPDLTCDAVQIAPGLAIQLGLPIAESLCVAQLASRVAREDLPALRRAFREHLRAGAPFDLELRLRDSQRYFQVRAEASSRFDAPGLGLIASVREVARVDPRAPRAAAAIEAAGAGSFEWNLQSGACLFDDTCCRMLGYHVASLPRTLSSWQYMVHPEDRPHIHAAFTRCLESPAQGPAQAFRMRLRLRCVDATWKWVELAGAVQGQLVQGLQLDGAEHHRRLSEIERAKQRSDAASYAKSAFLANMSEEIRAPMSAILDFADLAEDASHNEAELRDRMELVQRDGMRLLRILDDIFDLAKLEAGSLELAAHEVDIHELFEALEAKVQAAADGKELEISVHCDPQIPRAVLTDSARLSQILEELSSHAVEFTESGFVRVHARLLGAVEDARVFCRFTIEDSGRGLNEEQVLRVQQHFGDACAPDASTARLLGGTGIGFVLTRSLVELLGGSMTLQSEAGVGTVVTIDLMLPLSTPAGPAPDSRPCADGPAAASNGPLRGIRILLAEHGADNRQLLVDFLERAGAEVAVACDGREAFERVRDAEAWGFALVVLDMQMPEVDGYETARQIRGAGFDLPILALTSHSVRGDAERCLAAGCDAYATKPIGAQKLTALCAGLVAQHRADRLA